MGNTPNNNSTPPAIEEAKDNLIHQIQSEKDTLDEMGDINSTSIGNLQNTSIETLKDMERKLADEIYRMEHDNETPEVEHVAKQSHEPTPNNLKGHVHEQAKDTPHPDDTPNNKPREQSQGKSPTA